MDWIVDKPVRMFTVLGLTCAGLFGVAIWAGIEDQKQWDAFAKEHQCKQIAHINGYNAFGYVNGKYTTYWVSSKNTYHCNDGIDYTR